MEFLLAGHVATEAAARAFMEAATDAPEIDISEELERLAVFKARARAAAELPSRRVGVGQGVGLAGYDPGPSRGMSWYRQRVAAVLPPETHQRAAAAAHASFACSPRARCVSTLYYQAHARGGRPGAGAGPARRSRWTSPAQPALPGQQAAGGACAAERVACRALLVPNPNANPAGTQEMTGVPDAEVDRAVVEADGDLDTAVAAIHARRSASAPPAPAANGGASRPRAARQPCARRPRLLSCGVNRRVLRARPPGAALPYAIGCTDAAPHTLHKELQPWRQG